MTLIGSNGPQKDALVLVLVTPDDTVYLLLIWNFPYAQRQNHALRCWFDLFFLSARVRKKVLRPWI
jgi:hypothetical protein